MPVKLIEPVPDDTLRRMLGLASVRDRAIVLLLLDTGLRVSETAGIRLGDLRPDGSVKVMGKGAKERIVPIGSTARGAIVRCASSRLWRASAINALEWIFSPMCRLYRATAKFPAIPRAAAAIPRVRLPPLDTRTRRRGSPR